MGDERECSTAAHFREQSRMFVDLDDKRYEIRKIGPATMQACGGRADLMHLIGEQATGKREMTEAEAERFVEFQEKVLVAGVVSLKLVRGVDEETGRAVEPGDGETHVDELEEAHKAKLWGRIMVLSRASREAAEKLRPLSLTAAS